MKSENTAYRMGENLCNGFIMVSSAPHYQNHSVLVIFSILDFSNPEKQYGTHTTYYFNVSVESKGTLLIKHIGLSKYSH